MSDMPEQLLKNLGELEKKSRTDISTAFLWLESYENRPLLSSVLTDGVFPDSFAMPMCCYLHILQNNLIAAGSLLSSIDQQGDFRCSKNFLTAMFCWTAGRYEDAINSLGLAVNLHKASLYLWRKLLQLSLEAGFYNLGIKWYKYALSVSGWSGYARADLIRLASSLHLLNYDFEQSIQLRREEIALRLTLVPPTDRTNDVNINLTKAWSSLCDFLDILKPYEINPFPTAGTLLGWQRDGEILPFDKDLDLAIMPGSDNLNLALKIISGLPRYQLSTSVLKSTTYASIIDKKTDISIDLLEFWIEDDNFKYGWRLPGKYRSFSRVLNFTPFELVKDQWKGHTMWRSDNADLYLTELYGDWRVPDAYFDSIAGNCNLTKMTPMIKAMTYNNISMAIDRTHYMKAYTLVETLIRYGDNHAILDQLYPWLLERMK